MLSICYLCPLDKTPARVDLHINYPDNRERSLNVGWTLSLNVHWTFRNSILHREKPVHWTFRDNVQWTFSERSDYVECSMFRSERSLNVQWTFNNNVTFSCSMETFSERSLNVGSEHYISCSDPNVLWTFTERRFWTFDFRVLIKTFTEHSIQQSS